MQAAFEKLRGFFHGCDYEQALDAKPQAVLLVYLRAIDHVFGQNDGWKRLRTLVKELAAAFALAVPRPVDSRLIGERVQVRVFADELQVWYAQRHVETVPRLRGAGKHQIPAVALTAYDHLLEAVEEGAW